MADENMNTIHITEKQKVQEITDKLEEGLKELFESEKYKTYLSTMSKFHNYSFNNTLLIAMQKPEADINPIYIRDFLGHTDLKVTQIYSKTSVEMKRRALDKLKGTDVIPKKTPKDWTKDKNLLDWLNSPGQ